MTSCSFPNCDRPYSSNGLCKVHDSQRRRGRPLTVIRPRRKVAGTICEVDGCGGPVRTGVLCPMHDQRARKGTRLDAPRQFQSRTGRCEHPDDCPEPHYAQGWCFRHWRRIKRSGEPGPVHRLIAEPGNAAPYIEDGYVIFKYRGKKQFQHRLVMEQMIGRPLLKSENVHHINGVRDDNRPENLELWTRSQPTGQRVADKVAWAIELLALYQPDALSKHHVQLKM